MPNPFRTRSWVVAHRAITYGAPARKPRQMRDNEWQRWKFAHTNALGRTVWVTVDAKSHGDAVEIFTLTEDATIERTEFLGVVVI